MTTDDQPVILDMKNGYVHAIYVAPIINLEVAKQIVTQRLEFTNGASFPYLIEGASVAQFSKGARDFLASSEGVKGVSAAALLGNSIFYAMLANFFMKVTPTKIPVRMFNSSEQAVKWLKPYVTQTKEAAL